MRALTRSVSVSLLFAAPLAAQTYEPVLVPPQVQGSPTTATPLPLGDDSTARVDLGFEFTYWGQTFTSAWVSSNGFISFQSSSHLCCNGAPIEQAPRNTIYGFWTDLISGTNPYYTRGEGSILFGWYGTNEYGTGNQYTFEIGLKNDNSIRFNYGAMPLLTYHMATAGITGPEAGDNIQLFYGRDPRSMAYQSGVLNGSPPVATVDCNVTPMDPSCPPEAVAPVDFISSAPINTVIDAATADAAADTAEAIVASQPEPEQEIAVAEAAVEAAAETTSITQQVAEAVQAERLTPDQVLALAAPAYDGLALGGGGFVSFATIGALSTGLPSSSAPTPVTATESTTSSSSPTSASNTLEALNMSAASAPQVAMAQSDQQQSGNTMAEGQAETIAAIAAVPGFSAYTQVALQDRPDFYAPRDIYRNRRLRDANFEMYRLTRTNSDKLQEMIDAQYQR